MLPQMMPLPWLLVFFLIFLCFYTIWVSVSLLSFSDSCENKKVSFSKGALMW